MGDREKLLDHRGRRFQRDQWAHTQST
jgi:hypothetical protein